MNFKVLPILIFILIFVIGCQGNQTQRKSASSPSPKVQRTKVEQISHPPERTKNTKDFPSTTADRLVKIAVSDPNVHDATAVVIGRYAVVGIDVSKKLDASRVGTIKYSVAQALKNDPKGANAIVTADPDLFQRLREMADSIRAGHPIVGITDQLADIVSRIIPQVPKRVEERKIPKPSPPMNIQTH